MYPYNPDVVSFSHALPRFVSGKDTPRAFLERCIEVINAREPALKAFVTLNLDAARAAADAATERYRAKRPLSMIDGCPVGIKDIMDTRDMPTQMGSPAFSGWQPRYDAACVQALRAGGAVIVGKTVTTAFACGGPNVTVNPHDAQRTPGGSSSGSAAAVADCMVPIAFGTQTSSSVIRPAAYCGVIGYKPSFGLINRAGLKFLSESLDTLGTLTRSVTDAALVVEELAGLPPAPFDGVATLRPRIGFCRTPWWNQADDATHASLDRAAHTLAAAGARVTDVELAAEFAALSDTQITLSAYEFYRALTHERTRHPELISASLTARIAAGGRVTHAQYEAALALTGQCAARIADVFKDYDVLIAPSAPGEAPGIESTGEPIFGLMWTLLRLPCLTLPHGTGPAGLPLGLQVIAPGNRDTALFVNAEWIRRALGR